jgi:transcriptional regulator with XRE-family HTH domain
MGLRDNILIYREKMGLSADALGKKIGVSKQMIYQYEKGQSAPGQDKLDALAEALGVTVGQLYADKPVENLTSVKNNNNKIPFYDAIAVGGQSMLSDQTPIQEPADMIDPGDLLRPATGSIRIYGHSMFPKYPAGCIVAFKKADKEMIFWGEDYVIELEDRRMIKRIEPGEDKTFVKAVSYNKSTDYPYPPVEIPLKKIKRLFMVLGKVELEASL